MPGLKSQILNLLKDNYPSFINGGEIERFSIQEGYKASNGSRRSRELYESDLIERTYKNGCVEYRYKPQLGTIVFTPPKQNQLFKNNPIAY